MALREWQETLARLTADGPALTNVTPLSLLAGASPFNNAGAAARYTFPANYFEAGKALRVTAKGRWSNVVTTPGNFTWEFRLGSVVAWSSGAIAINTTAHTNVSFIMDVLLTCRQIGGGTNANLIGIGQWTYEGGSAGIGVTYMLPASAPAVGTGFDSSVAQVGDLFGTWSVNNASNTITLHEYTLEALN